MIPSKYLSPVNRMKLRLPYLFLIIFSETMFASPITGQQAIHFRFSKRNLLFWLEGQIKKNSRRKRDGFSMQV